VPDPVAAQIDTLITKGRAEYQTFDRKSFGAAVDGIFGALTLVVALIGTETPSRLKWLLDLQPASFLVKPLRSSGIYTALVVAFDAAQRRSDEAAHIERLEDRIRSRRVVFAAVLHVMRSHALCEEEAFALIRQTAMRYRTTIEQLSAEIMALGGMPNRTSRTA